MLKFLLDRILPKERCIELPPTNHDCNPVETRRMSANPVANGGLLRRPLDMPDFRDCAVKVEKPGATLAGNVPTFGNFLREVTRLNMQNFRVFGPDETQSREALLTSRSHVRITPGSSASIRSAGDLWVDHLDRRQDRHARLS
jgi:phosphoketolase